MSRRYGEQVEVRSEEVAGPASFLWRGRVYVVREVLGHWWERRPWWVGAAAQAVHGQGEVGGTDGLDGSGGAGGLDAARGSGDGACGGAARHRAAGREDEVWRVEASRGRAFGSGVYDLYRDPADEAGAWRLLRVAD